MDDGERKLYKLTTSQSELIVGQIVPQSCDKLNMVGFHAYMKDCRLDLLEKCWNRVLERNDALRIHIVGRWKHRQYIEPYRYETLPVVKVDGEEGFRKKEKEERAQVTPMFGGALYRVTLVDCGNGAGGMIACLHNLCCDGYTLEMIFEQLEELYALALRGEDFPPYKPFSYKKCIELDRQYYDSGEFWKDGKWWLKKYLKLRHYSIPVGHPKSDTVTDIVSFESEPEVYEKMTRFSEEVSAPVTSLILSAMALTTYRMTGKTCFCFYNLSHGRRTYAMRKTAGCMFLTNPVFFHIDPQKSFRDAVRDDYMEYLEDLQHGRFPWFWHFVLGGFQSFKLGFNLHHHWIYFSPMGLGGLSAGSSLGLEVFDEDELENPFYCAVYDIPDQSALHMDLNYQAAKFTGQQMDAVNKEFGKVLNWCLDHPDSRFEEIGSK